MKRFVYPTSNYKQCSECKHLKDQDHFSLDPRRTTGTSSQCLECRHKHARDYRRSSSGRRVYSRYAKTVNKKLASIKRRADELGREYTLTLDNCPEIPTHCPVLHIPLQTGPWKNRASLDRIDSEKGYIPSNVWWISNAANTAKSHLSLDELRTLVIELEKIAKQRQAEHQAQ